MADSPKCPECAGALDPVGNAWRCGECTEYFLDIELPEPPARVRRTKRPWNDDDE